MLAGMDGHCWRARERMRVHSDRLGLVVTKHVLIDLFGLQGVPPLVVAEQPESGRPVILVVSDGQILTLGRRIGV